MSFASYNSVQAAKGMQGTARSTAATFAGPGAPLQQPPPGMGGEFPTSNGAIQGNTPPHGSSYTLGAGMHGTGHNGLGNTVNAVNRPMQQAGTIDGPNAQGVVAGRSQMANVGQPAPQLTAAQMQDPANAALAGFQFSASQDQAPSASTNPGARPPPQQTPTSPAMVPQANATQGAQQGASVQPWQINMPNMPRMM